MRTEILTATQSDVLERLTPLQEIAAFYLAGGTALALRIGHRRSIDFDFFTAGDFDATDLRERLRAVFGEAPIRSQAPRTLYVTLLGVTTSFFAYRYPLLEPLEATPWGFGLAGLSDIAAMKLEAAAGRGSRKDFIDLYFLCRQFDLRDIFRFFSEKYRGAGADPYHRLRALAHFDDAEAEPTPDMLMPVDWAEVRRFFETRARELWESDTELP
jgi:hypothetical protein